MMINAVKKIKQDTVMVGAQLEMRPGWASPSVG